MANNAASTPSAALPKLGLLEEDDEFEEFPVEGKHFRFIFYLLLDWTETNGTKLELEEWEADWDDENIEDDFSIQLR